MEETKKEPQVLKLEIGNISAKVRFDIGLDDFAKRLEEIALISNSSKYADFVADLRIAKAKADIESKEEAKKAKAQEEDEKRILIEELKSSTDPEIMKYFEDPLFQNHLERYHIGWIKLIKDKKLDPYLDKLRNLAPWMRSMTLATDPVIFDMMN